MGGLGDLKHTLSTDYEIALICHKGQSVIRGKRDGSVWEIPKLNPNKMLHPTQKPTELMERLILKYSDLDALVCDPFLGSGTTAVAAVKTGRHYIGYEIDPGYYQICCNRLDEVEQVVQM